MNQEMSPEEIADCAGLYDTLEEFAGIFTLNTQECPLNKPEWGALITAFIPFVKSGELTSENFMQQIVEDLKIMKAIENRRRKAQIEEAQRAYDEFCSDL